MSQSTSRISAEPSAWDHTQRLAAFEGSAPEFLAQLLAAQCDLSDAVGGAVLRLTGDGQAELLALHPKPEDAERPPWLAAVHGLVQQGLPARTVVRPLHRPDALYGQSPDRYLVLVPLTDLPGLNAAEAFVIATSDLNVLADCRRRLEFSTVLATHYQLRRASHEQRRNLEALESGLAVLAAVNAQSRFRAAALALCNEIANRWSAERVSLGVLGGRYVKVQAISQTEHVNRKMQLVQDIEQAMEECLDQDEEVLYPPPANATVVTRAAEQLATRHGPVSVLSLPLRRENRVDAVLTIETPADKALTPEQVQTLRLTADLCTPRLLELHESDRWIGARVAHRTRAGLARLVGFEHTWAKAAAILVLAAVLFAVFAKGTHRVEAPFTLEATMQQTVSAPFDGRLDQVHVEPGDVVTAGQTLLAELDTAELQLELARLIAERNRHLKEADMARRDGSAGEVQIALAQADQAQAQIDLLEYRIAHARVVAPIDGVVVEGDWHRDIGKPISRGDVLFQIAALDSLRAELAMPDSRIGWIHEGQRGELAAAAQPGETIAFEVEHVSPIAEVREGRNVFDVRVKLLEQRPWFRPGIEGVAKADAGRRSYAWIWTHDAIDWLRMKLWL